jgi:hypothetical protein
MHTIAGIGFGGVTSRALLWNQDKKQHLFSYLVALHDIIILH